MDTRREFVSRSMAAIGGMVGFAWGCRSEAVDRAKTPALNRGSGRPLDGFAGMRAGEAREIEGLVLRWCPPGSFRMGSPPDEAGRRADEEQVTVTLTRGFWIGAFEVSQGEWRRIAGPLPDRQPSERFGVGDDYPAYWISYTDAEVFCSRLRSRAHEAGRLAAGWEVRLPTEAQWEYACRAGSADATAFGAQLQPDQANFALEPVPAGQAARATGSSTPVGSYPPNGWGIHDMHGNVWEWCRDWYHARLPGGVDPDLSDRPGVRNGDGSYSRVRRGGAWIESAWACRSACRLRYEPGRSSDHIGFRVVVVPVS